MIHIKDIFAKINQNASKAKFYSHNQPVFLKYFDSEDQYKALINAGNFVALENIVSEKSSFNSDSLYWCDGCKQLVNKDLDGINTINGRTICDGCLEFEQRKNA